MRRITVSDMTLKDKAHTFTFKDRTEIAKCLDNLGVDIIELPEISGAKEELIINKSIAESVRNCAVRISAGLSQTALQEGWKSISSAKKPCIQIYAPVSTVQMEYMCHMKAPQMLQAVCDMCAEAKRLCSDIEFCAADATRAEREFLRQLCAAAEQSGTTSITLCDDAGIMTPDKFEEFIKDIRSACSVPLFVQTSDAIYMAAACAMAALKAGADGVKTSVTEKSITSIDKFAQIIRHIGENEGIECGLNISGAHHGISELLSRLGAEKTAAAKPAADDRISVKLDKSSSMSDVYEAVRDIGYDLSEEDSAKVYEAFVRVVNKKDTVGTKELDAIVASAALQVPSTYHIESYVINSGNIINATAHIVLIKDGVKYSGISAGDGPIDAAFRAIEQIIGHHYELDGFQIQAVTEGREAVGSAIVKLRADGRLYPGNGISTDIVGASIRAYINAVNKIVYEGK